MPFEDRNSLEASVLYDPTKLVFGKGVYREVGRTIKDLGYRKALVVIGMGHVKRSGLLDQITESLRSNAIDYVLLEGITPNPEIGKVREGCHLILKNKCDCILAIGGGSVIDASKAMCVCHEYPDPWEFYMKPVAAKMPGVPIIACLTISATGSEMNCGAVVTNLKEGLKLGKQDPIMFPKVSFLDPEYQKTLSVHETNNGVVDTIVHLTESILGSKDGKREELLMSMDGALIRTCIKTRDELTNDFNAYDPRANFCMTSTLALNNIGVIFSNYGSWMIHQLQHNVGAFFHKCSHGAGLGVILPAWFQFCARTGKISMTTLLRWAKEVFGDSVDTSSSIEPAMQAWRDTLTRWGHPTTLRQYLAGAGYTDAAAPEAHDETMKKIIDGFMNYQKSGFDRGLTREDVESIYESCW